MTLFSSSARAPKSLKFWFLGISVGLILIHLKLTDQIDGSSVSSVSLLFWLAACSLVWQKRNHLNFDSGAYSTVLGLLLIGGTLLRTASHPPTTAFLGIYPFVCGLGLSLLASGFKGLSQYWQALLLLFFLGVPKAVLFPIIDISTVTAQFATAILWYLGFDVSAQGVTVMLPAGGINVQPFCSGLRGMFYLLGLAVLSLVMFPLSGVKKYFVPFVAMGLAFIVNVGRVVLMALVANAQNQQVLAYWHHGQGSLVFILISVLLFGGFYLFLLRQEGIEAEEGVEA